MDNEGTYTLRAATRRGIDKKVALLKEREARVIKRIKGKKPPAAGL